MKNEQKEKNIVLAKASKNKPLTPEEQQKAFEVFLSNIEQEQETQVILAKANKNKPLTPEEQQKAFEEYEASIASKESLYMKRTIGSTKNEPRTPEQQKLALKQFLKQMNAAEDPENLEPLPCGEEMTRVCII